MLMRCGEESMPTMQEASPLSKGKMERQRNRKKGPTDSSDQREDKKQQRTPFQSQPLSRKITSPFYQTAGRKRCLDETALSVNPPYNASVPPIEEAQSTAQVLNWKKHRLLQSTEKQKRGRIRQQLPLSKLFTTIPIFLLVASLVPYSDASVACETNAECESLLRPGSECIDNFCTNPFQQGCLRSYLGAQAFPNYRTCNSEDTTNDTMPVGLCTPSVFKYSEIRMLSQNWESAMFTAWILQIVLSELFQVPATIESSGPGRQVNFYDPTMSFDYGRIGYDFGALERANANGGGTCPPEWRTEGDDSYQSCAHVVPEVWSGQASTVADLTAQGVLEPPEGTGVVGKLGWFIPKFVAREDPSMAHWLGLTGNRKKVAETFKVPTTYGMYCSQIVPDNCTKPTLFASRPPVDEDEAAKYFVAGGVFNGYFRFAPQNDCDLNPDTCMGHVTDVPCEWTTFVTPQAYHLDLPVKSQGSQEPNSAYTYGELLQIWAASNATKSPILFYWWYPDPTYQFYLGSDAEMQAVQLPPPYQKCVTNRVTPAQRCSDNATERVGTELGSCDAEPHSQLKLVIANLFFYLNGVNHQSNETSSANVEKEDMAKLNPALRSPAYDAIQALSITELQLGDIFDAWDQRGMDKWNYDPREAVCEWVVQNLDTLETWIPRTYPRVVQEEAYNHDNRVLYGFAVGVGAFVSLVVFATSCLIYYWRKRPLLIFAQVNFLYFLLFGLELVAVGSVLVALEPKDATCVLQNWFVMLGYTLELVPLIVKVAAIHRMMQAAKKMRRITLNQRSLYMTVLFCCVLVIIVLSVWTAIDPSQRNSDIQLHPNRQTDQGETIVTITHFCASEGDVWRYLSLVWQMVLLLCATVLAFQTRNIRKDLNESHTLGVMIYSHFVFVVLRAITLFLSLDENTLEAIRSLLLSIDVFVATCVYFGPKIYGLTKHDDEYFKALMALQRRQSVHRSSVHRSSMRSGNHCPTPSIPLAGDEFGSHLSSFSRIEVGVQGPGRNVYGSSDPNGSSDQNYSSAISGYSEKRRSGSSHRGSFAIPPKPPDDKEIVWDPNAKAKESPEVQPMESTDFTVFSNDGLDLTIVRTASDIEIDFPGVRKSRILAAPPMLCGSDSDKKSDDGASADGSNGKDDKSGAPKEAHPQHGTYGEDYEGLEALEKLRDEAVTLDLEYETCDPLQGRKSQEEQIQETMMDMIAAETCAREEKRKSTEVRTQEMILDFVGRSSRSEGAGSRRRRKDSSLSRDDTGSEISGTRKSDLGYVDVIAEEEQQNHLINRRKSQDALTGEMTLDFIGASSRSESGVSSRRRRRDSNGTREDSESKPVAFRMNDPKTDVSTLESNSSKEEQLHNRLTSIDRQFEKLCSKEDQLHDRLSSIDRQFEELCDDDRKVGD